MHQHNNPASGTPATDGKHVAVFSGALGLVCYDFAGNEIWRKPFQMSKSYNGDGTSPLFAEGKLRTL